MSVYSFPDQTIPESEKDERWHIDHVLEYVGSNIGDNDQKAQMLKYYRAYNAELTEEEEKLLLPITCPHGVSLGVDYIVYPLIQNKIEQVVGEFMMRPIRRKSYVIDKHSKNEKYQKKLAMLAEELMREMQEELSENLNFDVETGDPGLELPEEGVDETFDTDFKLIAEEVCDDLINFFLDVRKEKFKLKDLFLDYAITDRAHAVIEKKNNHTSWRKVHPLDAYYDLDPYSVVQGDHEYFFENYYLTENEIYNTFPHLTDDQRADIRKTFSQLSLVGTASDDLSLTKKYEGWYVASNNTFRIRLVYGMWKSRKRVSLKNSVGKDGQEYTKRVEEDYKPRKDEQVEHIDGEMPRFVVMLGPDICLDWGEMEHRLSYLDAPWYCKLPVVSLIRENSAGSSTINSLAAKLYQLQKMASEILFEIRLAIKNLGDSRVLIYDTAQTPKAFSKGGYEAGLNRVLHHVKKDKIMFINSAEKGFKNSFNQFTSLDLSSRGAIQDMFNGLAIIEDLASKFAGISPEREGQIGQYQTATGVDKAIRGSTARTEILFTPFDDFIQILLERTIMNMKLHYESGEVLQYVIGRMKTKFLKLMEDFFLSDFGIFIADPRKDMEIAQNIDSAVQMALSNSNTPELIMGLIDVLERETAVEKKKVFQQMLDSMEEQRKQSEQAAEQARREAMQAQAEDKEADRNLTREGYDKDRDVAKTYANNKTATDNLKAASNENIAAAKIEADLIKENQRNRPVQ